MKPYLSFLIFAIFAISVVKQVYASSLDEALHDMGNGKSQTMTHPILNTYEDKGFSPHDWKAAITNRTRGGFSRVDQFHKLLQQYDLIGMPRNKVITLLGYEDRRSCYTLVGGGFCANAYRGLKIDYENDKVKGWRLETVAMLRSSPPWITTNVVWQWNPRELHGEFVPK
jgi:hypothetical protein